MLSHLLNSFLTAEENEKNHPFYYKNIYELTMGSETLAKRNKEFQKDLYNYYIQIFTTLKQDGVLKNNISNFDITAITYIIVLSTATWLQSNTPYSNELMPNLRISVSLSYMIRPYISSEYEEEFEKLMKEKGLTASL